MSFLQSSQVGIKICIKKKKKKEKKEKENRSVSNKSCWFEDVTLFWHCLWNEPVLTKF